MKGLNIKNLVEKGEGQDLEFKSKFTNDTGKDICAFANTNDGAILIGVNDDSKVVGIDEKAEAQIADISSSCDPPIRIKIERSKVDDKDLLVIKVKKSDKVHSFKGKVYVRVGSTKRALSMQEILELGQKLGKIRFDEQICEGASLEDIDRDKVKWYMEKRAKLKGIEFPTTPYQQILINLCAVIKKNGNLFPTNAGILFFGKTAQRFFPYCELKVARFKGKNTVEFIDRAELQGPLPDLIDETEKFVKRNTRIATKIIGFEQVNVTEYPYEAIREAIINAVTHRDYFFVGSSVRIMIFDDRIEIESPGKLPEGVTLKNLEGAHVLRNEKLANLLYDIGYIEKWGTGIRRMKDLMKNHGLEVPKFEERDKFFKVTFYGPGDKILDLIKPKDMVDLMDLGLNDRQIEALRLMVNERRKFTIKEYVNVFKVSDKTGKRDMKKLINLGLVLKRGFKKGAYFEAK